MDRRTRVRPSGGARARALAVAGVLLASRHEAVAGVAVVPEGPEIVVNSYTSGFHIGPAAAGLGNSFVVTWGFGAEGAPGPEDDVAAIVARKVGADGKPLGTDFVVAAPPPGYAYGAPDIASDAAGRFTIVWTEANVGPLFSHGEIHGQRFDTAGLPVGAPFEIAADPDDVASDPTVAKAPDGDFVVAWRRSAVTGDLSRFVEARPFSSNGAPLASSFRVDEVGSGAGERVDPIAAAGAGGFVVAWTNRECSYACLLFEARARELSADGTPAGTELDVGAGFNTYRASPAVAFGSGTESLVTWTGADSFVEVGQAYAQRLSSAGAPVGAPFEVATQGPSVSARPLAGSAGSFVVAWYTYGTEPPDDDRFVARAFDAEGNALVAERTALFVGADSFYEWDAAAIGADHFVVVRDADYTGVDATTRIRAQRLRLLTQLFDDGFEDGNVFGWPGIGG